MRRFAIVVLMAFLCASATTAECGPASARIRKGIPEATELFVNSGSYEGVIPPRMVPFTRHPLGFSYACQLLYTIEIWPGRSYTLGLTFPSVNQKLCVTFYDRWPLAPAAKAIRLPVGPVVKTNPRRDRYLWEFSVSPKSTSSVLYVLVEVSPLDGSPAALPHTIFVASPPVRSTQVMGQGITFLQGPHNLLLVNEESPLVYAVDEPAEQSEPPFFFLLPLPGDLIQNSSFRQGLNQWLPVREDKPVEAFETLSVHADGLCLQSASKTEIEGVRQYLNADVAGAVSLLLRADVKVERQTLGGTGSGDQAPVFISVGYQDEEGREHIGGDAFRVGFYALDPVQSDQAANGQKVQFGKWFRYKTDLMRLAPKPAKIRYIAVEGNGWPEREGWIRGIHLVTPGEKK